MQDVCRVKEETKILEAKDSVATVVLCLYKDIQLVLFLEKLCTVFYFLLKAIA